MNIVKETRGRPKVNDRKQSRAYCLHASQHERLAEIAERLGVNVSELMRDIVAKRERKLK